MRYLCLFFLFFASCLQGELIELQRFYPKILIDFRYATPYNSFGRQFYPCNTVYLDRYVAHRLTRVQEDLKKEGMGLVVHEGYRPPSVQRAMEASGRKYCKEEACHYCRGLGVDVSLYYLNGQPLELPCAYDTYGPSHCRDCIYLPAHVYHNSALLEEIMTRYGFIAMREKWWHFDLRHYEEAPDLQVEYDFLLSHPATFGE